MQRVIAFAKLSQSRGDYAVTSQRIVTDRNEAERLRRLRLFAGKARVKDEFSQAKEKLMRGKRNNPQRASEYDELLRSMEERLRKLDELNTQLQNRKTEITMKEMRLLPLEREVERAYPSRGNREVIEGAEKKK